jgi:hypothetical protein
MATRYIDSPDFSTASAVWTTAAKTTKAPNQWYYFGGIARQQVAGLLGPPFTCGSTTDNCAVRCAETSIGGYFGTRTTFANGVTWDAGMYRKKITRTSGKAAFRVEISNVSVTDLPDGPVAVQIQQTPTLNGSANPNQYPLRGISCENLYPAFFATAGAVTGPIQNRIYGALDGCYTGSDPLTEYVYNKADNVFHSRSNIVTASLGANALILTGQATKRTVFYMSPSGGDDIDLIIWNPCTQTPGADFTVDVFCSNTLREFTAYYQGNTKGTCSAGTSPQQNLFIGNVADVIGGNIGLYDWAFSDFMASGVRADGYYWLPGSQPGLVTQSTARVLNGIIVEWQSPCTT